MNQYSEVVVIGAGASGLLCAGLLGSAGVRVTIIEKNEKIGKKLAATGNGRCNFTNQKMGSEYYYGDEKWVESVLNRCRPEDVIRWFEQIGVYHRQKDGYVYPYTNQASGVVNGLQNFCKRNKVEIVTDCKGVAVIRQQDGYLVSTKEGKLRCRYVVLATGGKANRELGGDGSGYKLARSLGHNILPIYPGLTGLKCEGDWWNRVAGTRIQGRFSLRIDGTLIPGESGEIQIVKDGVSGIPVFQLCRVAAKALAEGRQVDGVIDFVPPMEQKELAQWISAHGIEGLVPSKWTALLKNQPEPEKILKNYSFSIRDTFGLERGQVTAGGVDTSEVSPDTMESQKQENVFITGELLNVDGKCGGYNLHFAWSCAGIAAETIIKRING